MRELHYKLLNLQITRNDILTESVELSLCKFDKKQKNIELCTDIFSLGQQLITEVDEENLFTLHQYTYLNSVRVILCTDGIYDEHKIQ